MGDSHPIPGRNRLGGRQSVAALHIGADAQQNDRPLSEQLTDFDDTFRQIDELNRSTFVISIAQHRQMSIAFAQQFC
jgi:hypothetical protein